MRLHTIIILYLISAFSSIFSLVFDEIENYVQDKNQVLYKLSNILFIISILAITILLCI